MEASGRQRSEAGEGGEEEEEEGGGGEGEGGRPERDADADGEAGGFRGCDSGHVSQSASGLWLEEDGSAWASPASRHPLLLRRAARAFAASLLADAARTPEVQSLDKSLEDLLTRVDEFVGLLDMVRSDSSQVVDESVPAIHAKATEMRHIYRKIDQLEAFVRTMGSNVAGMEERVAEAESGHGAFRKLLHHLGVPAFLSASSAKPRPDLYEPPALFRTEDYFPRGDRGPPT
ncbi:biogenesis of lysosome-related organelles complex 1 subunit 4 isoform X2 [Ornithorhynchus anatinus]|uniref:biogenesis of lysosome-related organelles complex 1 subunit 4 isoform X2 n=1 Tax=Ornithorhynchus anatinus TaxID=9258 RepID=UPI0010A8DBE3|nr:biogenesis of lysosome-related organelles complex 1 subunit 4 isoform X2 [Ornithorhynchus anatinus]